MEIREKENARSIRRMLKSDRKSGVYWIGEGKKDRGDTIIRYALRSAKLQLRSRYSQREKFISSQSKDIR